jgi:hypothetical protein
MQTRKPLVRSQTVDEETHSKMKQWRKKTVAEETHSKMQKVEEETHSKIADR